MISFLPEVPLQWVPQRETAVTVRLVEVILTSVTGKRQAFGDRRELSEDRYGLGNLQL